MIVSVGGRYSVLEKQLCMSIAVCTSPSHTMDLSFLAFAQNVTRPLEHTFSEGALENATSSIFVSFWVVSQRLKLSKLMLTPNSLPEERHGMFAL